LDFGNWFLRRSVTTIFIRILGNRLFCLLDWFTYWCFHYRLGYLFNLLRRSFGTLLNSFILLITDSSESSSTTYFLATTAF
jgi:hypothetical protein